MRRRFILGFVFLLLVYSSASAVPSLFDRLQIAVQTRNTPEYLGLVSADPQAQQNAKSFIDGFFSFQYNRAILNLAEESEHLMLVQVFAQTADEARFELWKIQSGEQNGNSVITEIREISSINGLFLTRLSKNPVRVRKAVLKHLDTTIQLEDGNLFLLTAGDQLAGAIYIGDATFEFAPPDSTEQQQLYLFCKKPQLQVKVDSFYFRSSAAALRTLFKDIIPKDIQNIPANQDQDEYSRALSIAQDNTQYAFGVTIPLTDTLWYPQLSGPDLICSMKSKMGMLLYQYSSSETEDVALIQKTKDRIVSLYRSGQNHTQPSTLDYKVSSYKLDLSYTPGTLYFSGHAAIGFTSNHETSTLVLKLNSGLLVTRISGSQGPLIYFQEKQNNNLHVVLADAIQPDQPMQLDLYYHGRIDPEIVHSESAETKEVTDSTPILPPTYLYSKQSKWYPELTEASFSPIESKIRVPSDYVVVSNGNLEGVDSVESSKVYRYKCTSPIPYFSLFVGGLNAYLTYDSIVPIRVYYFSIDKDTAMEYAKSADEILKLYTQWFGPYPFANLTLVLRPALEPGGHAPATIAIINRVYSYYHLRFRKDPLDFSDFPTFFLAHEIAHQWWGQSVGWRTYRDQWLSEGFAQFAAAQYIRARYGEQAWQEVVQRFANWIEDKKDAGPLILGTRLGHITNDSQAYSSIVYNKGAYIVNMLKDWLGDEKFYDCLKEYSKKYSGQEAGISEFQEVAQGYSQDNLDPFFKQWLYRWTIPDVRYTQHVLNDPPKLNVTFQQQPGNFYLLKVPVEAHGKGGELFRTQAFVDQPSKEISLDLPFVPDSILIDPKHENLATYGSD
jgi:Peptidase family M1 domain